MTVEVGMLNKQAVALAADSAVTSSINGKQKVNNSANKLFMLSSFSPVGIMIYSSASFMGVPWETIIKMYRKQLNNISFPKTEEYAKDFLDYLSKTLRISETAKKGFFERKTYEFLNEICQSIMETDKEECNKITIDAKLDKYEQIIENNYRYLIDFSKIDLHKYKDNLFDIIDGYLTAYIAESDSNKEKIYEKILYVLKKYMCCDYFKTESGIVIAGFGEDEFFPSLYSYKIEGLIGDELKYVKKEDVIISDDNGAGIIPFAQTSMINTFIQGVNPGLLEFSKMELDTSIHSLLSILKDEIVKISTEIDEQELEKNLETIGENIIYQYIKRINEYKYKNHVAPILDTIEMLGKEDLAEMAENLVSITSMEKKMSMDMETVGGPVDVAVISKGDGFIWYRRKHYFDPIYNPHYINKK